MAVRTGRDRAERLLALAPHLPPADRALIEAVFGSGRTCVQVAPLAGRSPRAVRARLARIAARLASPLFAWVVLHEEGLPRDLRAVARECVLGGRTLREAAAASGLTYHQARAARQALVAMSESRLSGTAARTRWGDGSSPSRSRDRARAEWRSPKALRRQKARAEGGAA